MPYTVALRSRPFTMREKSMAAASTVTIEGNTVTVSDPGSSKVTSGTVDHAYDASATQSEVWADVRPLVDGVMQGGPVSVLAYGQSGAGKSYSMFGYGGAPESAGIVPRFCAAVFEAMSANTDPAVEYAVDVAMMEIYREQIQDLLNPRGTNLKITRHPKHGTVVKELTYRAVDSAAQVSHVLDTGSAQRSVASTLMNATSSRAHTIVQLRVQVTVASAGSGKPQVRTGVATMVDLAGSERVERSGSTGARLKEGTAINLSLSSLGQCIKALADGARIVPYRNSKLTLVLQDSLSGTSYTFFLIAVSPADCNYDETVTSLRYGMLMLRAKAASSSKSSKSKRRTLPAGAAASSGKVGRGKASAEEESVPEPPVASPPAKVEEGGGSAGEEMKASAVAEPPAAKRAAAKASVPAALPATSRRAAATAPDDLYMSAEYEEQLLEETRKRERMFDEGLQSANASLDVSRHVFGLPFLLRIQPDGSPPDTITLSSEVRIGSDPNLDGAPPSSTRLSLNGMDIRASHCTLHASEDALSVSLGAGDAHVCVNGQRVEGGLVTALHHGDRLLLGVDTVYVVQNPMEPGAADVGEASVTWGSALEEHNKAEMARLFPRQSPPPPPAPREAQLAVTVVEAKAVEEPAVEASESKPEPTPLPVTELPTLPDAPQPVEAPVKASTRNCSLM